MSKSTPDHLLAYIHVPTSALPISPVVLTADGSEAKPSNSYRSRLASFPPSSSLPTHSSTLKGKPKDEKTSLGGLTGSLSSSVSDMFIGSILPSTLPKSPALNQPSNRLPGRPRALSSQREALSIQIMGNNFRRFVARCGPAFWVQDRVEEIIYWRKPTWTWSWMMAWSFISFYPRLLLLTPSLTIILILLHQYSKSHPTPSNPPTSTPNPTIPSSSFSGTSQLSSSKQFLLNNSLTSSIAVAVTGNKDNIDPAMINQTIEEEDEDGNPTTGAHGSTVDEKGAEIPAVPPGTAESGVDYYMNLQAIQNLMGLVSDAHDTVLPYITLINPSATSSSPLPPPTTFPLSATHLIMLLLPPTLLLPLLPTSFIPFLLLPIGLLPPIVLHPSFSPEHLRSVASNIPRGIRFWRAKAERWVLTDRLEEGLAKSEIREVNVWESERLDPSWTPTPSTDPKDKLEPKDKLPTIPPTSSWSSKHLRSSERQAWVRTIPPPPKESLWKEDNQVGEGDSEADNAMLEKQKENGKVALVLTKGWMFVPGEEWRVDLAGGWSSVGADEHGWVYSNDDWENPTPEYDMSTGIEADKRVTRRRQWWRRVART